MPSLWFLDFYAEVNSGSLKIEIAFYSGKKIIVLLQYWLIYERKGFADLSFPLYCKSNTPFGSKWIRINSWRLLIELHIWQKLYCRLIDPPWHLINSYNTLIMHQHYVNMTASNLYWLWATTLTFARDKKQTFDPFGRPTVTAGSDHCCHTCCPSERPSQLFKIEQNKTNFKRKPCSLLARLLVWPSGSSMTRVLFSLHFCTLMTAIKVANLVVHVLHFFMFNVPYTKVTVLWVWSTC